MFVAHGPEFASGTEVEPFANVELYNLMCGQYCATGAPPPPLRRRRPYEPL